MFIANLIVYSITNVESVWLIFNYQIIVEFILITTIALDSKRVSEMISGWYARRLEKKLDKITKELEEEEK